MLILDNTNFLVPNKGTFKLIYIREREVSPKTITMFVERNLQTEAKEPKRDSPVVERSEDFSFLSFV